MEPATTICVCVSLPIFIFITIKSLLSRCYVRPGHDNSRTQILVTPSLSFSYLSVLLSFCSLSLCSHIFMFSYLSVLLSFCSPIILFSYLSVQKHSTAQSRADSPSDSEMLFHAICDKIGTLR